MVRLSFTLQRKGSELASKSKKIVLWLITIFVGVPIFFGFIGLLMGTDETQQTLTSDCQVALQEDIDNISSGMTDKAYSVSNGFTANLSEEEIQRIADIFPSYTNPRIIAATIEGASEETPVGIWAIQQVTDNGSIRITSLNSPAREYSVWGSAANEGSPAAQLRDQLLSAAKTTNVESCAKPQQ
jgi:hypothetical protein